MGYITTELLRQLLGNVSDNNVTDEILEAADIFVNGTINSKIGGEIPIGNIHYGKAVGIAYLLGKSFAQFGNETEKVRDLDFEMAMRLLDGLYADMAASGSLNLILATDKATIDDIEGNSYVTAPLNPNGITVIGTKVIPAKKNAVDVITSVP